MECYPASLWRLQQPLGTRFASAQEEEMSDLFEQVMNDHLTMHQVHDRLANILRVIANSFQGSCDPDDR